MKPGKHIFFITNGGIGTGPLAQGVPAIQDMVSGLKEDFAITIFSLAPAHKNFIAKGYKLIAPKYNQPFAMRMAWIFFRFFIEYKKAKPALIHSIWGHPSGIAGAVLKKIFHIPLIIHLQGGDSTYIPEIRYGVFLSPFKSKLLRWAYQKADILIALTEFHKHKLQETEIQKVPYIIPFGVDTDIFSFREKNIDQPYKLLHIASINKVKSPETILTAFSKILSTCDAHLTIIGEDTLNGELQKLSQDLNLNKKITFTGLLKRDEIIPYLQESHVLMHASLFESQAIVVNEALACGLVVCGTEVGLISDLASTCTLATPIRDSDALAHSVVTILSNPDKYAELSEKGIQWSNENDLRKTIEKIKAVYKSLPAY